jgi:hypothetical protein
MEVECPPEHRKPTTEELEAPRRFVITSNRTTGKRGSKAERWLLDAPRV